MKRAARFLVAAAMVALCAPSPARADAPGREPTRALALYEEGRELLRVGETENALARLEASMKLLPSPNTELLVAHALRKLQRRVEAMKTYERVVESAGAQVRAGEARYRATLVDAGRWMALLRAELCQIDITVTHPPTGARVTVDGEDAEAKVDPSGGALRARVWHAPGHARILAGSDAGARREAVADLVAGGSSDVQLDFGASGPPPDPARSAEMSIAMWTALGVGVSGMGLFVGFGARAASAASDLSECEPHCQHTQQLDDTRDSGNTSAAVANVSLAVGATALVASGLLWWFGRPAEAIPSAATRPRRVEVGLGLGTVRLRGDL